MGQKTIPQLTEATEVGPSALIPIDTGIQTFKITFENMALSMKLLIAAQEFEEVSDDYTVQAEDRYVLATGTKNLTMPPVADVEGLEFTIKNVGDGTITILPDDAETFDGAASYVLPEKYQFVKMISDGIDWNVVAW